MKFRWIVGLVFLALLAACGQPIVPPAPTGLSATNVGGSVELSWTKQTTVDLDYNVYRSTSSPVGLTAGNRIATVETVTTYTDSSVAAGTTYYYVVTADSGVVESPASNEASVTVAVSQCAPYSTLACSDVLVDATTAFSLDWNATEGGVAGTGFTMVEPSQVFSGTSAADGLVASNLAVQSGNLVITTTSGIMLGANNNQENALGVGFDATTAHTMSTTLPNASWSNTNQTFEQGGLWFGLDDDDYVKLVVVNDQSGSTDVRVELRREQGGTTSTLADALFAGPFASSSSFTLTLALDPTNDQVTGSYSIDGGASVDVGTLDVDPALFAGTTGTPSVLPSAMSFGGVFATHRNGSEIDVSFDAFTLDSN